jgi:hypothetical protein
MPITNKIASEGLSRNTIRKTLKTFLCLCIPPVILLGMAYFNFTKKFFFEMFSNFYGQNLDITLLFTVISFTMVFATAYALMVRVANGISDFVSPQFALATGCLVSIICTLIASRRQAEVSLYIAILGMSYLIACGYLVLMPKFRNQIRSSFKAEKSEKYESSEGNQYKLILLVIGVLSTSITIIPRWIFGKSGDQSEVSTYLSIFLLTSMFFSITSVLGNVFWVESIIDKTKAWDKLAAKYRIIVYINVGLLIPYLTFNFIIFSFFNISIEAMDLVRIGIIGWIYFGLLNLHLVGSNALNNARQLMFQGMLMLLQLVLQVGIFLQYQGQLSAMLAIICQITVFGFVGVLPTYLYLRRSSHAN